MTAMCLLRILGCVHIVTIVASQQLEAPPAEPAPLVCSAQPTNFIAVSWAPTCECTTGNQTKIRSDKLPCGACYEGKQLANYQCRAYDNLINIADLRGGWGASSTAPDCDHPAKWAVYPIAKYFYTVIYAYRFQDNLCC
eukprot:SAG31_NODE_14350_length_812_cov_0.697055_1_plen_139_part_00